MEHIYNISAILDKMVDRPRAQRLQRMFNKNDFDTLTQEQIEDLISIIFESGYEAIMSIHDNCPHILPKLDSVTLEKIKEIYLHLKTKNNETDKV